MKVSVCSYRPVLSPCSLKEIDYQVVTYVGCEHHCYYCYVLNQAETDWRKEILMHEDITSQLCKEIEKIYPQTIYMGYHTDPYQPCEEEYRQTRKVLELLLENGFSASILTKSNLFLRDVDILREMDNAAVSVSVAFNDNHIRRHFEANTIDTEARVDALIKIKAVGIKTGALICPVIPFITDAIPLIDMLDPHADEIWIYGLSILNRSDRNWKNVQRILYNQFPNLEDQIEMVVISKDHLYWAQLRKQLIELQKDRQLNLNIHL